METPRQEPPSRETIARGYEAMGVSLRGILISIGFLVGATVIVQVVVWWLMVGVNNFQARSDVAPPPLARNLPPPPEPRLQPNPSHERLDRQDMQALLAREQAALSSYGWVDRQTGVVRIPIDRAMQIVVERGLPVAPTTRPSAGGGS
ncbi:MAG: hypothetical protein ACREJC_01520 [Tepidisphaeraceae bacterium]